MPAAPSHAAPLLPTRAEPPVPRRGRRSAAALLALGLAGAQAPPVLELRGVGASEGHVRLAWTPGEGAGEGAMFELQSAASAGFEAAQRCYTGPELVSFRSGLPAGTHWFRVRQRPARAPQGWGPWSEPLAVEVAFYPLATAWTLFALGAALVASIVGFLLVAERRTRRSEGGA